MGVEGRGGAGGRGVEGHGYLPGFEDWSACQVDGFVPSSSRERVFFPDFCSRCLASDLLRRPGELPPFGPLVSSCYPLPAPMR